MFSILRHSKGLRHGVLAQTPAKLTLHSHSGQSFDFIFARGVLALLFLFQGMQLLHMASLLNDPRPPTLWLASPKTPAAVTGSQGDHWVPLSFALESYPKHLFRCHAPSG